MSIREIRNKFSTAVERAYSWCIIIFVIWNLVLGTIIGFGIGTFVRQPGVIGFIGAIIGLVVGSVLGDLVATMMCGFAASVIHISETNDKILSKFSESPNIVNRNSAASSNFVNNSLPAELNKKTDAETSSANNTQSNVWVCTKCGATNPVGSMLCQHCGH